MVVRRYVSRLPSRASQEPLAALLGYLERMPETTALMLLEDASVPASHPLRRLARERPWAYEREFSRPRPGAPLTAWLRQRAGRKGAELTARAAELLGAGGGTDLRRLDGELEKLILYAAGRPLRAEDVELLCSTVVEATIFAFVDALGERDGGRAQELLHSFLARGSEPLYLLTMIARQVRLLLQQQDLAGRGLPQAERLRTLGVAPFVLGKLAAQAARFSPGQLRRAHQLLVEVDWWVKRGRLEPGLGLELLVAELTGGRLAA